MKILAIETSCDETAAAVTDNRRVLSNVIFSQINIHKEYGGVYPALAKRAHKEKIGKVIEKALNNANIKIKDFGAIAVTFGPGLVIALEVGLNTAKMLAEKYKKPLIPVDHIEGHIYSCFAQNRNGHPKRDFVFPFLASIVSGGTTEMVIVNDHLEYEVIGKTLDDAAGEALDKAAKILGLSYPGGPIIEKLAETGNPNFLKLPLAMVEKGNLDFSYSGVKTAFRRGVDKLSQKEIVKNLNHLCASFQSAVFEQILRKTNLALLKTGVKNLAVCGGVIANKKLRIDIKKLAKKRGVKVFFPSFKKLVNDNAAMIGVAAYFKYKNGIYLENNFDRLDRVGRTDLKMWTKKS